MKRIQFLLNQLECVKFHSASFDRIEGSTLVENSSFLLNLLSSTCKNKKLTVSKIYFYDNIKLLYSVLNGIASTRYVIKKNLYGKTKPK